MEGDIALGLKYVGAGLATLGMIGAAIGVGNIFSSFLDAAMRNPSAAPQQYGPRRGTRHPVVPRGRPDLVRGLSHLHAKNGPADLIDHRPDPA